MPRSDDMLQDTLRRVSRSAEDNSATRACLLLTQDREHALATVQEAIASLGKETPLYHFTIAERRRFDPARQRWEQAGSGMHDPAELLRAVGELRRGVVVIEDCAAFLRDDGGDRGARMTCAQLLSPETISAGLVLIFLEPPAAEAHLPGMLAAQFVRLDLGLPRAHELERLVLEEMAAGTQRRGVSLDIAGTRAEAPRLAAALVGMTRSRSRDMVRDGLAGDVSSFRLLAERLHAAKSEHLARELAMTVLDTSDAEDPIGLDYLCAYLSAVRERATLSGSQRARGVLLVGPPGTGKTMLARSLGGRVLGLPVVEFRVSSLMNSLLGETERRFTAAFATLASMAPNVVFIDELEKAFGDSSERDGGTMMRCTGALLSWLSDNPAPNFLIATANDVARMGQVGLTMTRAERFDAAYFVDVPGLVARHSMLERWLTGLVASPAEVAASLAEVTAQFSGADLRSVVKKAASETEHRGAAFGIDALCAEAERRRPRAIALYDEFATLRRWGRTYCEPAGPSDT